jgi:TPR repeat protein
VRSMIFCLATILATQVPSRAQNDIRIGVVDLTSGTVSEAELHLLSERLRIELFRTGEFTVLEREKMDLILREQGFHISGVCATECVIEMGQLLGMTKMVIGNVGNVGTMYTMNLKMVDVETGALERVAVQDCACDLEEVLTKVIRDVANELAGHISDQGQSNTKRKSRLATDPIGAQAQEELAYKYYFGEGVAQDYTEAARLFRLAAEQGLAVAQDNLGYMYRNGFGVAQDYTEAARLHRLAVEQGNANASYNLGVMYRDGLGVAQNYAIALPYFYLAAEQGHAEAQYNLGVMYREGQGVAQDYAEAVRLYRLAAEQGLAEASCNLGVMYANGQGVPQDYTEAVRLYRLAAAQGNANAQANLDDMLRNGLGESK